MSSIVHRKPRNRAHRLALATASLTLLGWPSACAESDHSTETRGHAGAHAGGAASDATGGARPVDPEPSAAGMNVAGTNAGGTGAGGTDAGRTDAGGTEAGGADAGGADAGGAHAGGATSGGTHAGGAGEGGSDEGPRCTVPERPELQPVLLSNTGCVDMRDPSRPARGLLPYDVTSPLWSDGATKERFILVPPAASIHVLDCAADSTDCADPALAEGDDGQFRLPVGTVLVKNFSVGGRRVETRLLMRRTAVAWRGASYEWNEAGTEATLLEDEKIRKLDGQTWHYPSPSQCMECHTKAAGRALGLSLRQLDRDFPYPDGPMNQLEKLELLGVFDVPPKHLAPYPDPFDGRASLDQRARSYLHSNCATCHRPSGSFASLDLRFTTPMSDTRLCNVPSERDNGIDSPVPGLRLVPGRPAESALSFRMHDVSRYRMPTLGSNVLDAEGAALIDAWITNLAGCSSPEVEPP